VASAFETRLTVPLLRRTVEAADLRLKEVVLAHLDEIFRRFVTNTAPPPS